MKVAVLGAQGTGKTQLVRALRPLLPTHYRVEDSTPLMTALYSELLSPDASLYADALAHHRSFDLTLVMGLDLAQAPADRQHKMHLPRNLVDTRLRHVLNTQGIHYAVVYGTDMARTDCARLAIAHHAGQPVLQQPRANALWQWSCEKCSDAGCEHRMFTTRLKIGTGTGQV